ncbi:hypothetical protein CCHR01_01879 [Colletotrichum chrysophilum]|uniref:Uncharacterized protein n=1 Tax=Colletotrichum chrysophilum TaxID=1836956 RepID=A0AAD9ENY7_9PEZI|nr:hypothetical protein CCHR01_01879 [Colletotrichum chrysophilum]
MYLFLSGEGRYLHTCSGHSSGAANRRYLDIHHNPKSKKDPHYRCISSIAPVSSALHRRDCCSSVELVCSDSRLQSEDQHREAAKSKKHWQREVGHATTLYYPLLSSIPAPKYCTDQSSHSATTYYLPTYLRHALRRVTGAASSRCPKGAKQSTSNDDPKSPTLHERETARVSLQTPPAFESRPRRVPAQAQGCVGVSPPALALSTAPAPGIAGPQPNCLSLSRPVRRRPSSCHSRPSPWRASTAICLLEESLLPPAVGSLMLLRRPALPPPLFLSSSTTSTTSSSPASPLCRPCLALLLSLTLSSASATAQRHASDIEFSARPQPPHPRWATQRPDYLPFRLLSKPTRVSP